jgi:hypothetical protein
MNIRFSVRQDFVGQNPRNSSHKNQQVGEECTGDYFRRIWKDGQAKARDTAWVAAHISNAAGSSSINTNWADVCVCSPTGHGTQMAKRMDTCVELEMVDVGNATKVKIPNVKHNIAGYCGGHAKNLRNNLKEWEKFDACPGTYCDFEFFTGAPVVEARRELADPEFLPTVKQTKVMSPVESYSAFEKCMFFWQHAYVRVTANKNVLHEEDASQYLRETWRFQRIKHGIGNMFVPVDFGAYSCTCRQFAKYVFCEHCVIVGTLQRIGQTSSTLIVLMSLALSSCFICV